MPKMSLTTLRFFLPFGMNKYVEHIEELLYLHDCVIVPGFGGFICDYTSASINEKTGTSFPRLKKSCSTST